MHAKRLAAGIAAALICTEAATAQMWPVWKEHAYSGLRRPAAQLAAVHGKILMWPFPRSTNICEVDGKSYRGGFGGGCPSIVYLLPGRHQLVVTHAVGTAGGATTISVQVAAGRVYEIVAGPMVNMRASLVVKQKPPGFVLTYKDVTPHAFVSDAQLKMRIDPAAD